MPRSKRTKLRQHTAPLLPPAFGGTSDFVVKDLFTMEMTMFSMAPIYKSKYLYLK